MIYSRPMRKRVREEKAEDKLMNVENNGTKRTAQKRKGK